MDAPESWKKCQRQDSSEYRCGKAAAFALNAFLAISRPTRRERIDFDRDSRIVANCFRADGQRVNAWLVRTGNAVDWVRYSHDAFAGTQASAQAEKMGIWRGNFTTPGTARAKRVHRKPTC
ncbi:thermonuclease family protein [Rhizobium ruizarguesonis]|uniref:thermonuclease family protein n=1 Tax=Rhizobium ruizarguesonis TaxID=2081791 RepID=UPI001FE00789|nr:thermonuclease family protein [Rhizobium ruizarguesonis]